MYDLCIQAKSVQEREKLFHKMELEMQMEAVEDLDRRQETERRARDLHEQVLIHSAHKTTVIASQ